MIQAWRCLVVPRDDPVVKTDGQIRELKLVNGCSRNSLKSPAKLVGEQSRGASLERRQAGQRLAREFAQLGAEPFEWIGSERRSLHDHACKRIGGQKRIPPDRLTYQCAVEQDDAGLIGESAERFTNSRAEERVLRQWEPS